MADNVIIFRVQDDSPQKVGGQAPSPTPAPMQGAAAGGLPDLPTVNTPGVLDASDIERAFTHVGRDLNEQVVRSAHQFAQHVQQAGDAAVQSIRQVTAAQNHQRQQQTTPAVPPGTVPGAVPGVMPFGMLPPVGMMQPPPAATSAGVPPTVPVQPPAQPPPSVTVQAPAQPPPSTAPNPLAAITGRVLPPSSAPAPGMTAQQLAQQQAAQLRLSQQAANQFPAVMGRAQATTVAVQQGAQVTRTPAAGGDISQAVAMGPAAGLSTAMMAGGPVVMAGVAIAKAVADTLKGAMDLIVKIHALEMQRIVLAAEGRFNEIAIRTNELVAEQAGKRLAPPVDVLGLGELLRDAIDYALNANRREIEARNEAIKKLSDKFVQFSPDVARERAFSEVANIRNRVAQAELIGGRFGRLEAQDRENERLKAMLQAANAILEHQRNVDKKAEDRANTEKDLKEAMEKLPENMRKALVDAFKPGQQGRNAFRDLLKDLPNIQFPDEVNPPPRGNPREINDLQWPILGDEG